MKKILTIIMLCAFAGAYAQSTTVEPAVLNMFNVKHGGTLLESWIYLDAQNNFEGAAFAPSGRYIVPEDTIVIPAASWTNKIAAAPGTAVIAHVKGVHYWIYVTDYIIRNSETVKTTTSSTVTSYYWDEEITTSKHATETRRNEEILGVRVEYHPLFTVKTAQATAVPSQKPSVFVATGKSALIVDKIKAKLTGAGCMLTQNAPASNFQLFVTATERQFNSDRDFVYCYVDIQLELYSTSTGEAVYFDDFSQKGVSTSRDRAIRAAVDDAVEVISEKITPYIITTKQL